MERGPHAKAAVTAKFRKKYGLALADSLVYPTAKDFDAKLVTSDPDLKDFDGTIFLRD